MPDYLYNDLTSAILDCYYKVFHSPSSRGLTEDSLTKALVIELCKHGLRSRQNVTISHHYDDRKIGSGRIDLLVEEKVVVEIKRLTTLRPRDKDRLKAYLLDGGYAVGLLLNFGSEKPHPQRVYEPSHDPRPVARAADGSGGGE
jgi:GxxExxY protein